MVQSNVAERSGSRVVGIVGVGQMGLPIARRVLAAGFPLVFFARRPEVAAELKELGASGSESLEGLAAACDLVIVCVYDDDQVKAVCLGPRGLVSHMPRGSVLINHTTGDPETARILDRQADSAGVRFLDAALSGSPAGIGEGRLTLWVGGAEGVLSEVTPVLGTYADSIMHVGNVGDGQWVKLVNNALFAANVALVSRAELVLQSVGLRPQPALEAIRHGSGDSSALGTITELGGAARLVELAGRFLEKDVATVKQVARKRHVDLGVLGAVAEQMGASE